MSDNMLRAYKASLVMEPIALLDYYVKIITYTRGVFYGKVDFYEAIPPFQWIDFAAAAPWGPLTVAAAIAAGTTAPKANVTNLDLEENEFGQWRFFPLDNINIQLFNPGGVAKWQLKNIQVGVDKNIIYRDPTLCTTEFFSYEDRRPAMVCTNFSAYAKTAARIIGWGYRFHMVQIPVTSPLGVKLQSGVVPSTPIQCAGYVGTGEKQAL
jgi:hypothetical protein